MKITKMQGAGNDFLLINNIDCLLSEEDKQALAKRLCQRRISFGADGMIFLEKSSLDFSMDFYNADGSKGEMCGNGARCLARFAYDEKVAGEAMVFDTAAGAIKARRIEKTLYEVRMQKISVYEDINVEGHRGAYIELGSPGVPHFCLQVDELSKDNLISLAETLRHHKDFVKGANINFYLPGEEQVDVLTFERGVEDFTLACGSGVTSVFYHLARKTPQLTQRLFRVPGGELEVRKERNNELYLLGPALRVYQCELEEEGPQ
ncbi:MAG: diaminopimelate epimerase [Tissierellia bacterium]|nr:diaminopimelate epimerase [Tissierellia bacterium]